MWAITKIVRTFSALLFSLLVFPVTAGATVVQPTAADISVLPGETKTTEIWLENEEGEPRTYDVQFYAVSFGESIDDLALEPLSASVRFWVTTNLRSVTLVPGERRAIQVTVSPSASQERGSYPVAIVFSTQSGEHTAISATTGVSSLLFITVEGDLEAVVTLDAFTVTQAKAGALPVHIASTLTNTGERILRPEVTVDIRNLLGWRVGSISLNPTGKRVPLDISRSFSAEWPRTDSSQTFVGRLKYALSLPFGPMHADLSVIPAEGAQPIVARQSFSLLPNALTLGVWGSIIIVITLIVIGLVMRKRKARS